MTDHITLAQVAEIADALAADGQTVLAPTTTHVHADPVRGHIVLTGAPERETPGGRDVAFVDLGSVLQVWSGQGASLTPTIARELGKALVAWADKKNPPPFDLMVTLTGMALGRVESIVEDGQDNDLGYIRTLRFAVDDGTFKVKVNEDGWSEPLTDGVLIQEGHDIP